MSKDMKNEYIIGLYAQMRFRRSPELDSLRNMVLFPRKVARAQTLLEQLDWGSDQG
jgi:hypothetical protein